MALQEVGQFDPAFQSYKKVSDGLGHAMHRHHPPANATHHLSLSIILLTQTTIIPPLRFIQALEMDGLYAPALQNLAALTVAQGRFKLALGARLCDIIHTYMHDNPWKRRPTHTPRPPPPLFFLN